MCNTNGTCSKTYRRNCKDCRAPDEDVTPKVLTDLGFTNKHQGSKLLKAKVAQNVKILVIRGDGEFMR